MADFKQYNPAKVVLTFNGVRVTGFMDGTFLEAERTEDAFEMSAGAGGDVARVRKNDRSGSVTLTLQQTSPSNDILSALALQDEQFGTGVGELLLKDINGTTVAEANNAWIRKVPNAEFSDSISGREWVFDCAELALFSGGSVLS